MSDKNEERIVVVPRASLAPDGAPLRQGFFEDPGADWDAVFSRDFQIARRGDVENDPSFKQIIPYVVITRGAQVFVFRRLPTQDEERLRNLLSIGVGGHMREEEGTFPDMLRANLRRELDEELRISGTPVVYRLGYVNDDSNEVGSVHLGVVYECRAIESAVQVRESDLMEGEFVDKKRLRDRVGEMETWSSLIVNACFL